MSTEALNSVRSQMLFLSGAERAELALELIKSLDEAGSHAAKAAWDDELVRRISMVRNGEAELLTREELRHRVKTKLGL